tara:strand:+ start:351 stop:824 length:474 start_codon:yes stop_codon:yes gene_type:complete
MFNVGREFNKIASRQGAGFFGALPQANQRQETRFAGDALRNIGRYKAAETGVQAQAAEASANRRNSLFNSIIGAVGNVAGAGLSAHIGNQMYLKDRYGSSSMTPYSGPMPSTTAPSTGFSNTPGSQTWGPIQSLPPLPGIGGNAQGQNPYSINNQGW